MTDKEKKNKIADILLDFYDEYDSNVINRPMIPSIYAGKIIDSLQEESVSEELEEAAIVYNKKINFVVAGKIPNEHFIAGAKWQKDKMIQNTIEAHCFGFQGAALFSFRLPADNYLVGSEVKVIVIKKDEL